MQVSIKLLMIKKDYIQMLRDVLPELQRDYGVTGLAVFGSVARGDNDQDSDIDLLVDMPPRLFLMSGLRLYLESLLHVSVDLIRRHSHLSTRFLNQISRDAIILL